MTHISGTQGHTSITKRKTKKERKTSKKIDILREATKGLLGIDNGRKPRVDRQTQHARFLQAIDRLNMRKFELSGRVRDPGTTLRFQSGTGKRVATTQLSTIMDRYHEKALRMAQAKYYQK